MQSGVMIEESRHGRIVVGVDGSESSKQALRWAVRYAAATDAAIDAVMAWQLLSAYGWYSVDEDSRDVIKESRKVLAETIIDAVGAQPPVTIHARVEQGHPAELLLHEAEGAELLVVGSRGHGGFMGALLGSISQYCAYHAPCPVVIVRAAADTNE